MPSVDASEGENEERAAFWAGSQLTDEQLLQVVDRGYDAGILPAASGLVLLDCDVKTYDHETGFVVKGGSVRVGDLTDTRHGIDDLVRVVKGLGHSMEELRTYTVSTKSGGLHLYYRENPLVKLRWTGHRVGWLVDVITRNEGRDRSWAAAPPTAGYQVVRDLPVLELPDWLALWLRDELPRLEKPGGKRRKALETHAVRQRDAMLTAPYGGGPEAPDDDDDGAPAWQRYVAMILELVRLADQHGNWNNQVYATARDLLQLGYDEGTAMTWICAAAPPWSDRERRVVERTVRSAAASLRRESQG